MHGSPSGVFSDGGRGAHGGSVLAGPVPPAPWRALLKATVAQGGCRRHHLAGFRLFASQGLLRSAPEGPGWLLQGWGGSPLGLDGCPMRPTALQEGRCWDTGLCPPCVDTLLMLESSQHFYITLLSFSWCKYIANFKNSH